MFILLPVPLFEMAEHVSVGEGLPSVRLFLLLSQERESSSLRPNPPSPMPLCVLSANHVTLDSITLALLHRIPPMISQVHHITNATVARAPKGPHVWLALLLWVHQKCEHVPGGARPLFVAHNAW